MWTRKFQIGDWVVYRKTKHSSQPGPRASNVSPAPHGETYAYTVDKFWIVESVRPDGSLSLQTRTGKQHTVDANDPCLRHASLIERLLNRSRFEAIQPSTVRESTPAEQVTAG